MMQNPWDIIETGFPELDIALGGGFVPGLALLGGLPSSGRTSFCVQLADQIAEQGKDVLFFSFVERAEELQAKILQRRIFQKYREKVCTTQILRNFQDLDSATQDRIRATHEEYCNGAGKHLFVWESRGQEVTGETIREAVANHEKQTGSAPFVILDYLQLLTGTRERMDDFQTLGEAIRILSAISRDHKTTVLAISSYNRQNSIADANIESFYCSNKTEGFAYLLISLQPKYKYLENEDLSYNEWLNLSERETELKILKNRHFRCGDRIGFCYYPKVDTFMTDFQVKEKILLTSLSYDRRGKSRKLKELYEELNEMRKRG